jgi:uncharacterized protein (TIGR00725 family)
MTDKEGYSTKYKICVSGAAETSHCGQDAFDQAEDLGKEIARQGAVLVNGATTGFPYWASKGTKSEQGIVLGISPAYSEWEHINVYKLPVDYQDLIIYTGQGYSGRNLLLTRSADAVVVGCGRIGTINEFTIAFEDGKPIGILQGDWDTDEVFKTIIEKSHRAEEMKSKVIYSRDPKELISKLIELIAVERTKAESNRRPL